MKLKLSKKGNKALNPSLKAGAIALVFLLLGYQVALFVHKAAAARVASNRDAPDTVFVVDSSLAKEILESSKGETTTQNNSKGETLVRKNAEHSHAATELSSRNRKPEEFRFNPNTVSAEDLQRLGFSPKQAQALDNYRSKGGRFARKSDFAKSFVVSEQTYKRLEKYIDIPLLDLNKADSAAFDALPGIGGYFAAQMVRHRAELGAFNCKKQLLNIYNFGSERYDGLSDLVFVAPEDAIPFPLWTLPEEELQKHPYIRNRETARGIVLFRKNNPPSECSLEALLGNGVISQEQYGKLSNMLIQ